MEKWRKLIVWKKTHILILKVYKITEKYPKKELYSLVSQMRRAAISINANIVEGCKRKTNKDKKHFYLMSDTSLEELKYYFILSYHLNYINVKKAKCITEKAREIGKMLNGLSNSLR
ncbi:MAG: four helix bundle protein [Patescibacteria group bacterium]|jgi:four helix bundle protein